MIVLITGKIGGGKTYFAVNYTVEKFFEYKPSIFQYVPNRKNFRIITNIDSLEMPHSNLDFEIEKHGIEKVFSREYVGDDQVVFIIDEAQKYFDRKFYNKKVFEFFQMIRHYGVDCLLITQDVGTIARELRELCEYEIEAQARSRRTQNTFIYKYKSQNEIFKRQMIRFNKKVAMLYRSQLKDESEKVPKVWRNFVIIGIMCVLIAGFGFTYVVKSWGAGKKITGESAKKNPKLIGDSLPIESMEIESHELSEIQNINDPVEGTIEENTEIVKEVDGRIVFDLKKAFQNDLKKGVSGSMMVDHSGRVSGYVVRY